MAKQTYSFEKNPDIKQETKKEIKSSNVNASFVNAYSCGCERVNVGVQLGICPEHRCP